VGVLGFLVFRGWNFLKTEYLPAVANVETKWYQELLDTDLDNDGLSDIEESFYRTDLQSPDTDGDGYLDGEEIASGYDPRIAAPNDVKHGAISKAASDINLTSRLIGRLYASVDEGEIDVDDFDSIGNVLDDIVYNTTLESLPIFYAEDVEESEIIILYEYTDQAMQEYSDQIFKIINDRLLVKSVGHLSRLEEMLFNFDENGHAFRDEAQYYLPQIESALDELFALQVPKPWVSQHMALINIIRDYEAVYEALETSDSDIMKAIVVAREIIELDTEFNNVFAELVVAAEDHDLELPDLALILMYKDALDL
jgi:hypothetical protein